MSHKTKLQTNNTNLQTILDSVNALTPTTLETWYCTLEDGTVVTKVMYVGKSQIQEPSVSLIEFTIDGTTYQAVEGMTWAEWVESEYNTCEGVLGDLNRVCIYNGMHTVYSNDASYTSAVTHSDEIVANYTYYAS